MRTVQDIYILAEGRNRFYDECHGEVISKEIWEQCGRMISSIWKIEEASPWSISELDPED